LFSEETVHRRTHTAGREKEVTVSKITQGNVEKRRRGSAGMDKVVGVHIHEENLFANLTI
jgi:hypothetical protein